MTGIAYTQSESIQEVDYIISICHQPQVLPKNVEPCDRIDKVTGNAGSRPTS